MRAAPTRPLVGSPQAAVSPSIPWGDGGFMFTLSFRAKHIFWEERTLPTPSLASQQVGSSVFPTSDTGRRGQRRGSRLARKELLLLTLKLICLLSASAAMLRTCVCHSQVRHATLSKMSCRGSYFAAGQGQRRGKTDVVQGPAGSLRARRTGDGAVAGGLSNRRNYG